MPPVLHHRLALVTGAGRKRGIGAAVCRALAEAGANVAFTHLPAAEKEEAEQLAEELRQTGVRAEAIPVDLSRREAAEKLLDAVEKRLGAPAILVNNAAHSERDISFQEVDAEILDAHYAVNLRTTLLLSAEFARRCPADRGGRIIQMTSGQSLGPMPGELAYVATKGGIEALTRTLAAEVAPKGITVNAVNPGPTDTGWMTPAIRKELAPRFPMGRLGEPADAARLVVFLASPEAGWITGQVIHSEGGFIR